jgi:hypothetical protein
MKGEIGIAANSTDDLDLAFSFAVRACPTPTRGTITSGISRTRGGLTKEMETCADR